MLLQTGSGGWRFGLLLAVLAGVGLVSYWVYRDADARDMADAPYWGAAVGVAAVVGLIVGGVVAVGVYLSVRPDEYAGGQRPFGAIQPAPDDRPDPAHADLPPIPELTEERVTGASETTLRGYARRYDRLDATGDPQGIRTALLGLVEADETDRLGETVADAAPQRPGRANDDHRRHVGRPRLRTEREPSAGERRDGAVAESPGSGSGAVKSPGDDAATGEGATDAAPTDGTGNGGSDGDRGFEWVEDA